MAAYGLLQGWRGNMQFAYNSPDWLGKLSDGAFDLLNNPPQILQFPAAAAMWHRGDVQEAGIVAESLYTPEDIFEFANDRIPVPRAAALIGKVGYQFVEQDRKPFVRDISRFWNPETQIARSETGELLWDAKRGVVTIDTPRTQAVIGFLSTQELRSKVLKLQSDTEFGALWVTALDGERSIVEARSLLITAVSPARNTGMEYDRTGSVSPQTGLQLWHLKSAGTAPALMRAVTGHVSIQSSHAGEFRCWILDVNGKRSRQIQVQSGSGRIELNLLPDSAFYYELQVR